MAIEERTTIRASQSGSGGPIHVTYGRLAPGPSGILPDLAALLSPGRRLTRGTQRNWERAAAEFRLGDVLYDDQAGVVAGRIGYEIGIEMTMPSFDSSLDSFVPQTIVHEETVAAAFAVDVTEGWVVVEEAGDTFPPANLLAVIVDFINATVDDTDRVTGRLLLVNEGPWEYISRNYPIVRVSFVVTPSNPGKRWRELDADLADARAKRLKQEFENANGLSLPDEGEAREEHPIGLGIEMTLAGYGDADELRIEGFFDARPTLYDGSNGSSYMRDELDDDPELQEREGPNAVLRQLIGKLADAVKIGLLHAWTRGSSPSVG